MILARAVEFAGRGLHGGRAARVAVLPRPEGHGPCVRLQGRDLPLAGLEARGSARSTLLSDPASDRSVSGVEHLLAALAGTDVWDVILVPEGEELPVLDGSAYPFAREILEASRPGPTPEPIVLGRPVRVGSSDAFVEALPGSRLVLEVTVEFEHPHVGRQRFVWSKTPSGFIGEISKARTFGFMDEVESLRARGLAAGGGLDCALVFGPEGVLNPEGARYPDEPVRHKTLDLLGDLALLGRPLLARVRALRPSHALNQELVRAIRQDR